MLAYFLMISLPFIPFLIFTILKHKGYKINTKTIHSITIIFFLTLFFLLLACRDKSVGVDMVNYLRKYYRLSYQSMSYIWNHRDTVEIGYGLLNKLLASLGVGNRGFIVIMSLLSVFPIAWLYGRETDNWMLTASIFVILPNFSICFSGLRQALAIAVVPFAYYFVTKKKPVFFVLMVLLAMSFHNSAFFLLLMYPVYHIRIKKKWLVVIVPALLVSYALNKQIYSVMIRFLGGKYEERYSNISGTGAYTMLLLFVLMAIISFMITDEEKMTPEEFGMRNILLFSVALQFFAPVNSIAMRVNYYYLLILPITMPRMLVCCKDAYHEIAKAIEHIMTVFFYGYFLVKAYRGHDTLHLYPYKLGWRIL